MSGTRVGLVCGYLDPTRDGVADYTCRLAVHLRPAGVEPVIVTTHELARAAGEGAIGVAGRWDVRGVAAAARVVRQLDLDLVHVQFAPSVFRFSRAVGILPALLPAHIPLVVTVHEYGVCSGPGLAHRLRSGLWSAAERRGYADRETLLLVPRATGVLVPSPEHLDVLGARFRRHPPVALEVPNGLNVEITTVDRALIRAGVRRELGVAPDAPLVAFFGFLHPEKALDRLIAAVAAVRAQWPQIQLLLIGGEVSHSVPGTAARQLRRHLERVAAACGLLAQVHFTGYLADAEVSRLLQAADLAAFPFDAGVTRKSSSLLAALAAGLPVVAAARPGELREPREAGGLLRVPPGDTAALTAALRLVLADRALAGRLAAAGRARATSQNWNVIAAAHAEVYSRVLASRRGGEPWTRTAEPSRVVPSTAVEGDANVAA